MKDFAGEVSDTKWVERMLRNNVLLREEVERLTAEVARLRLRPKEWEAIDSAKKVLVYYGANNCAVGLLNIVDRLGGGE